MKLNCVLLFLPLSLLIGCKESTARRPISYKSGEFIKQSAERNKEVLKEEMELIETFVKKDSGIYLKSDSGFWYKYIRSNPYDSITPQKGNVVEIEFDIRDIKNNIIYTKNLNNQTQIIGNETIIKGLRQAIMLMKKGETMICVIPSALAYGLSGDGNKIGVNEPIISEITLKEIKNEKVNYQ